MNGYYFAQQTLNAIQVSSYYGLLAVAYVLVHGITGRVNLAFGALAAAMAGGLIWFIARHPFGRIWRALADDPAMAALSGVNFSGAIVTTMVIASAYAGSAGAMLAIHYGSVSFHGGLVIGLKTLFVAVVGGLNSVSGAFAGALLIGFAETYWSAYFGLAYRDVAAFALLAGLLVMFPQGIFATPARRD